MPIINMVYKKKKGWEPGANTVAYYPLTSISQGNDMKGLGTAYNLSGTATFGVDEGVDCYQCKGTSNMLKNNTSILSGQTSWTFNSWVRCKGAKNPLQILVKIGGSGKNSMFVIWIYANTNKVMISDYNTNIDTGYRLATLSWVNLCVTNNNGQYRFYVNGVNNYITSSLRVNMPSSGNISLGYATYSSTNEFFYGNVSEVIIEKAGWTADEVSNYYNQTKSKYGIS